MKKKLTPEQRADRDARTVGKLRFVHPDYHAQVVEKLEAERNAAIARAEKAEAEVRRYQAALANEEAVAKGHNARVAAVNADLDKCRTELAEANEAIRHESTARGIYFEELQAAKREIVTLRADVERLTRGQSHNGKVATERGVEFERLTQRCAGKRCRRCARRGGV